MKRGLDIAAMRAFLLSIRAAADAALSLIEGVSSGRVQRAVHPVSTATGQQLDSTGGQQLDSALSSSDLSSSLSDSEDLAKEERERREARPLSRPPTGQQLDSTGGQQGGHVRNAALAGCWDGVGGVSTGGSMRARIGEVVPLLERLARERGVDPVQLFQQACDRFKRDETLKAKRMCTLPVLLSQLEQWVDEAPKLPPNGSAAPVAVAPARKLLNPRPPAKEGAA